MFLLFDWYIVFIYLTNNHHISIKLWSTFQQSLQTLIHTHESSSFLIDTKLLINWKKVKFLLIALDHI